MSGFVSPKENALGTGQSAKSNTKKHQPDYSKSQLTFPQKVFGVCFCACMGAIGFVLGMAVRLVS